jgi:UrcA family protein
MNTFRSFSILNRSVRSIATVAVAFGLALAAPVAGAGTAESAPRIVVDYGDLDLTRPAGAEKLYQRLSAAATAVCGVTEKNEVHRIALARACRDQAIARAAASIKDPAFAAWYAQKSGRTDLPQLVAKR